MSSLDPLRRQEELESLVEEVPFANRRAPSTPLPLGLTPPLARPCLAMENGDAVQVSLVLPETTPTSMTRAVEVEVNAIESAKREFVAFNDTKNSSDNDFSFLFDEVSRKRNASNRTEEHNKVSMGREPELDWACTACCVRIKTFRWC